MPFYGSGHATLYIQFAELASKAKQQTSKETAWTIMSSMKARVPSSSISLKIDLSGKLR